MNYPLAYSGQVRAAAGLAEAVDRHRRVGVISRAADGTAALLDQAEHELSSRRIRCVRVQGPASGGLALRGFIAQVIGHPDPGALTDSDLKAGFVALTEPGSGHDRVALLVAEAHSLLPSAMRYIQLACQSTPTKLCVVLAGQPSLAAILADDGLTYLRGVMHVVELPEPAGQGLFDPVSAVPDPRVMPAASRRGGSSLPVRLGLAAMIVPIVGLIWWRHLPAVPALPVSPQDVPSVPAIVDAPVVAPFSAPPIMTPEDRAEEPARSEPDLAAAPQAGAGGPAEPDPAPPDTPPEVFVPEAAAKLEAPVESSATERTEPPAVAEPPALAAEPPPTLAAEPPAAAPEHSEPPQSADLGEALAPQPAGPTSDAAPPPPDPAIAAKPPIPQPPHGTLTVTTALPAHGGAKRAVPPAALPTRAVEEPPGQTDERRCRDIVLKAQLGKDPSDADKQFLRNGCRRG